MRGATHALFGALAGASIAIQTDAPPLVLFGYVSAGVLAGLLPDIDHPNGALRRRAGLLGHAAFGWLKHRGMTHSLVALLLVSAVAVFLLPRPLALTVGAAYGLHILADMMTLSGVPILLPFSNGKWYALPPGLRIRTGTIIEVFISWTAVIAVFVHSQIGERMNMGPIEIQPVLNQVSTFLSQNPAALCVFTGVSGLLFIMMLFRSDGGQRRTHKLQREAVQLKLERRIAEEKARINDLADGQYDEFSANSTIELSNDGELIYPEKHKRGRRV